MWYVIGFVVVLLLVWFVGDALKGKTPVSNVRKETDSEFKTYLKKDESLLINRTFPGLIDTFNKRYFCGKAIFIETENGFGMTHSRSTFLFMFYFQNYVLQISLTSITMEVINDWKYPSIPTGNPASFSKVIDHEVFSDLKKSGDFNEFFQQHLNKIRSSS